MSGPTGVTGTSGVSGTTGGSGTSGSPPQPGPTAVISPTNAYDLFETNGAVVSYAGARNFGSEAGKRIPSRIVAATVVPGGGGYWSLTSGGTLYPFGDAANLGTANSGHHAGVFTGLATTPDGSGLWAVSAGGSVIHLGDAPFCGSPVHQQLGGAVTGVAGTPDGRGYWVFTAAGNVYAYGDAPQLGSDPASTIGAPLVGLAPSGDGLGYWLAYANGQVRNYGDAVAHGSTSVVPTSPIVSIAATASGGGYWLVDAVGQVFSFGATRYHGGLRTAPPKGQSVVAIVATTAGTITATPPPVNTPLPKPVVPLKGDPYVHGAVGYDISNFQCAKKNPSVRQTLLPGKTGLAVLQVAGWLDSSVNPCLASQMAWARKVAIKTDPQSLYVFLNAPTRTAGAARQDASGPAGACARLALARRASCRAYNYGYNGALAALRYSAAKKANTRLWWLDVEGSRSSGLYGSYSGGTYWAASQALNDRTIQGAIDALRRFRITVGIYSSSLQYDNIAGKYKPKGARVPLWVAGVPWTKPPYSERGLPGQKVLKAWCNGTAHYVGSKQSEIFAGGYPWLLQETPGNLPSPFGIDPDYAC